MRLWSQDTEEDQGQGQSTARVPGTTATSTATGERKACQCGWQCTCGAAPPAVAAVGDGGRGSNPAARPRISSVGSTGSETSADEVENRLKLDEDLTHYSPRGDQGGGGAAGGAGGAGGSPRQPIGIEDFELLKVRERCGSGAGAVRERCGSGAGAVQDAAVMLRWCGVCGQHPAKPTLPTLTTHSKHSHGDTRVPTAPGYWLPPPGAWARSLRQGKSPPQSPQ
jgi:hypothetical protein